MKTILFKKIFFIFIVSGIFGVAIGQQRPDSLEAYIGIASRNNPAVLQKYNDYQAALQKVPQVGSLNDPELSLGVFLSPMELISGKQVADIRLMQMFPWFGVLKNAKDEMSLMAKAKYESFLDEQYQVCFETEKMWYLLYKIREDISISEQGIALLQTIERISLAKFKAAPDDNGSSSANSGSDSKQNSQLQTIGSSGMQSMTGSQDAGNNKSATSSSGGMQGSPMSGRAGGYGLADLYRIQIETGDLENKIAELKSQERTTITRFNALLNRPAISSVSLPQSMNADTLELSLFSVSDSMLANNSMLEMLKYEQQSFDARKNMVKAMSFPMIGVGVNYSVINKNEMSTSAMNGNDMIMPMVTVTLPIYRNKYKAMQTETSFMKSAVEESYKSTSNSLQTEYYEAIQLYEDSGRRLKLYENQSLLAQRTLEILIKSFSTSTNDLNEVLRMQQQTLDYKLKKLEAFTDYNTSIAWLRRLMANSYRQ